VLSSTCSQRLQHSLCRTFLCLPTKHQQRQGLAARLGIPWPGESPITISMSRSTTLPSPSMDISALVNHDGDAAVLPRRSRSISHSISASSPVTSSASLPPAAQPTRRQMPQKRRRHDPKPIWAYREGEQLSPELQKLQDQREQARALIRPTVPSSVASSDPSLTMRTSTMTSRAKYATSSGTWLSTTTRFAQRSPSRNTHS
jgi:hypothetical protein